MINYPIFSIVIANFNNGHFISEAIDSLINQSYRNIEIIIIDDCSTDNSVDIIRVYASKEARIRWFTNKQNKGYGYSIHKGFSLANGEIIGRLDPDDALELTAIEEMVKVFEQDSQLTLAYSKYYICDEELSALSVSSLNSAITTNESYLTRKDNSINISHFACFTKGAYAKTLGVNPRFRRAVDKDLYYKLEEVGKTFFLNKPLYYYRQHQGSISLFDNTHKAIRWEIRAKKDAYKRRLKMKSVPNISKSDLRDDFEFLYRSLIEKNIKDGKYLYLMANYFLLFYHTMRFKKSILFFYYTLKKSAFPHKFNASI